MVYDIVFVHAAQMEKQGDRYVFSPEDKSGFLHGEIRVEAAKVLRDRGMVKQLVVVGGPTRDGVSKSKLMADLIGGDVVSLETKPYTQSNIDEIKRFLEGREGVFGLLTSFYHLPRAMRMAIEGGLALTPICAESILISSDSGWYQRIREWYGSEAMLVRILSEIQGLSALESNSYANPS